MSTFWHFMCPNIFNKISLQINFVLLPFSFQQINFLPELGVVRTGKVN